MGCAEGIVVDWGTPSMRLVVQNELAEQQLLHWHGLSLPSGFCSDGVPMLTGRALDPGESALFVLPLPLHERGTMFLHSHYGLDEQKGAAAPLIIAGGQEDVPGCAGRATSKVRGGRRGANGGARSRPCALRCIPSSS